MPFYLLYIVLLLIISILYSRGWKNQILTLSKGSSWILTGISLFMVYLSAEQGQLIYEVLQKHGIWGLWQYWSSMIGVFVVPLVFAPIWHRLQLVTDNDFIPLRYSGMGAKVLQVFRAYYVGMIIVMLLLSFHVLAFSKVLMAFFEVDKNEALLISGICLFVFSLKNSFSIKIKTDLLHYLFYLVALLVLGIIVIQNSEGLSYSLEYLKDKRPETLQVWPADNSQWFYSLIFLGIQWWSVQQFDGGGQEMLRYRSAKTPKAAVLTGLVNIVLALVSSIATMLLVLMIFAVSNSEVQDFNTAIIQILPAYLHPLIVIGWFGLFISSCESLLIWGVGFWTKDLHQRIFKNQKEEASPVFILGSMVFLSILAILTAFNAENLESIIRWFFALSAGVAPIFILRWFWMRINAWTQLTAMASVPFLNLLYNFFDFSKVLPFHESEMGAYVWRLIILTILTLVISFTVMVFTPKDDSEHLSRFIEKRGPIEPLRNAMILAILLGLLYFILWNYFWTWLLG
jgi:SSS family solute:Na+ symporter